MRIQNLANISYLFKTNRNNKQQTSPTIQLKSQLSSDVVSFSGKNYSINSVKNQTNHCAYCGCKVYNEAQIDSIVKEILSQKSHRLQGSVRSVLEKLESAVRSEELAFAKKVENKEEIEFFKKLLQISTDKSFLKGEQIFEQVYSLSSEEASEILKKNMRPLTKTIDHVSPQRLDEDNVNSDINLVEACYTCNHDLKKGVTFAEFYAMFPSIKENMPPEKFQYAHSNLLASSSSSIINRMSATTLLRHIQSLFGQREQAQTRLNSIDFRIVEANASIDRSVQSCEDEIEEKQAEIAQLQQKLDTMTKDDEYNALIKRIQLNQQKDQAETVLSSLKERRRNASDALNELRNPPKKNKKQSKVQLSKEEKEERMATLRETISSLTLEIQAKQDEYDTIELEIMELNSKFPTIEMLQIEKTKADNLCSQHAQLAREKVNLEQLQKNLTFFENFLKDLETEIEQYPNIPFDVSQYSDEEQALYSRYTSLLEAQKYIDAHLTGGGLKAIINSAAKNNIDDELAQLSTSDVVLAANSWLKRKEIQTQIDGTNKQKEDVRNQINASQKQITTLTRITSVKTLEQAQKESAEFAQHIRVLNEKQAYLKLPQTIATLKAEILLLQETIRDLTSKKAEIDTLKGATP